MSAQKSATNPWTAGYFPSWTFSNEAVMPHLQHFWKAQDEVLKEMEGISHRWFERRHAAARSALDTVRKTTRPGVDFETVAEAIRDWQTHSFERMTEDLADLTAVVQTCTALLTRNELEAEAEVAEAVTKESRRKNTPDPNLPV